MVERLNRNQQMECSNPPAGSNGNFRNARRVYIKGLLSGRRLKNWASLPEVTR
jgi:hypothetical protein